MVREKIRRVPEYKEVIYNEERWSILKSLRRDAKKILKVLTHNGIPAYVHGSIARGDVWEGSDVDIIIPYYVPSYKVEYALEAGGFTVKARYIVVATPSSTPKAYIVLDYMEKRVVSFPLAKLQTREWEFYRFGGLLDLEGLERGKRVPGVTKELVLVEPTPRGHRESPVIGYEEHVAAVLGISVDTVLERVRVLSRRDEIGRTGVFVKYVLPFDETFESALEAIARRNPWVRRVLRERGF